MKNKKIFPVIFLALFCVLAGSFNVRAQDTQNIYLANEYLAKGEVDKALEIFRQLAKKKENMRVIHNQYLSLLISSGDFKTADKHLRKLVKLYPKVIVYQADQGSLLKARGKEDEAKAKFSALIKRVASSQRDSRNLARYFY
ncbi:tetratricopeptide repeat protein [Fulvitalea axinellae]|uniref:tetratricopeptide repeat protein n=1 Tax=Fulvitalea axinellae TaxID=1182444 RepID=UPI0030CA4EDA